MLKGHTKIELTDVISGEVTTVEDDNIITNALSNIFNSQLGFLNANPFKLLHTDSIDTVWDTLHNFFQGLLLFDSEIEENPDIIYPPAGIRLVGCGSNSAYTGNNIMAGSYNSSESGLINDGNGFKYVWDFATNQGNGIINSVCLTTKKGGYVAPGSFPFSSDYGWSNSSDILNFNILDASLYVPNQTGSSSSNGLSILHFDANKNEYIFASDYNETYKMSNTSSSGFKNTFLYKKQLTLSRVHFPITEVSLFDTPSSYVGNSKSIIETVVVRMPDELQAILDNVINESNRYIRSGIAYDDENYIYIPIFIPESSGITNSSRVFANEVFYVWKIDVNDFSSSCYTVTNTTGEDIYVDTNSDILSNYNCVMLTQDYTIVIGYQTGKVYIIDNNDNTNVTNIKFSNGDSLIMDSSTFFSNVFYDYEYDKVYFYNYRYSSSGYGYVLDLKTKEVSYVNCSAKYLFSYVSNISYLINRKIVGTNFVMICHDKGVLHGQFLNTLLMTINNLESPVTKTQAQTMKVTYTLTKAIDEG